MATKKPKKLNYQKVRGELELLAAGANGARVHIDDADFPNLQTSLYPETMATLAHAVADRWFAEEKTDEVFLFSITNLKKWTDFDTLATAIIEERHRLDSIKKVAT